MDTTRSDGGSDDEFDDLPSSPSEEMAAAKAATAALVEELVSAAYTPAAEGVGEGGCRVTVAEERERISRQLDIDIGSELLGRVLSRRSTPASNLDDTAMESGGDFLRTAAPAPSAADLEEEPYINFGASVTSKDSDDEPDYDTLGIHYDDDPEEGGVLPDAERSVGVVSEITSPSHYIPLGHVCVPALPLSILNEEVPNMVDTENSDDDHRANARSSLQAGLEAQERGAFDSAAAIFSLGRKQLGRNGWEVDGETMLKLCSEGAHASYIIDDVNTTNELIDEVIGRGISVEEKFRVYEVKMLIEQGYGNHAQAIELGFDVRRKLGMSTLINIPCKRACVLSVLVGYAKTCRALRNRTAEELASLPILTDEKIIMGQRMLELIEISCFQVGLAESLSS